eukprot:1173765-Prorocentrum_minimum.AAC.2
MGIDCVPSDRTVQIETNHAPSEDESKEPVRCTRSLLLAILGVCNDGNTRVSDVCGTLVYCTTHTLKMPLTFFTFSNFVRVQRLHLASTLDRYFPSEGNSRLYSMFAVHADISGLGFRAYMTSKSPLRPPRPEGELTSINSEEALIVPENFQTPNIQTHNIQPHNIQSHNIQAQHSGNIQPQNVSPQRSQRGCANEPPGATPSPRMSPTPMGKRESKGGSNIRSRSESMRGSPSPNMWQERIGLYDNAFVAESNRRNRPVQVHIKFDPETGQVRVAIDALRNLPGELKWSSLSFRETRK